LIEPERLRVIVAGRNQLGECVLLAIAFEGVAGLAESRFAG
jgi:hypothetical protein